MCPLPPRGFHFAMQPYGRAPPLSNPSLVSASNPGGPHFCVFSFSLSVSLSLLSHIHFSLLLWHSARLPAELLLFAVSFSSACERLKRCFLTLTELPEAEQLIAIVIRTPRCDNWLSLRTHHQRLLLANVPRVHRVSSRLTSLLLNLFKYSLLSVRLASGFFSLTELKRSVCITAVTNNRERY